MSAVAIRTIRRLDERSEVKTVHGYAIEAGIPIPGRQCKKPLYEVILAMQIGESIVHATRCDDQRRQLKASRRYVSRRIGKGKYRIWRVT